MTINLPLLDVLHNMLPLIGMAALITYGVILMVRVMAR